MNKLFSTSIIFIGGTALLGSGLLAQQLAKPPKEHYSIKIIEHTNGKEKVIDRTFATRQELDAFMGENEIEQPEATLTPPLPLLPPLPPLPLADGKMRIEKNERIIIADGKSNEEKTEPLNEEPPKDIQTATQKRENEKVVKVIVIKKQIHDKKERKNK